MQKPYEEPCKPTEGAHRFPDHRPQDPRACGDQAPPELSGAKRSQYMQRPEE